MSGNSGVNPNAEAAQRIQETFDAYFLALIFTLLGASIQTAKFGGSAVADTLEIVGWLCFLVSGLSGLSYLELMPRVFRLHGLTSEEERKAKNLEMAMLEGKVDVVQIPGGKAPVPVKHYITESRRLVEEATRETIGPIVQQGQRRFLCMKWFFVAGLISVVMARSWIPANTVVHRVRRPTQVVKPAATFLPPSPRPTRKADSAAQPDEPKR